MDTEELRRGLLDEIYAGAFAGMPAMLLVRMKFATQTLKKLRQIAKQYGMS